MAMITIVCDVTGPNDVVKQVHRLKLWIRSATVLWWNTDEIERAGEHVSGINSPQVLKETLDRCKRPCVFITQCSRNASIAESSGALVHVCTLDENPSNIVAEVAFRHLDEVRKSDPKAVVVACVMKPSRQTKLCKEKVLHLEAKERVIYFPLDLPVQVENVPHFDQVLVKCTDYLEEVTDDRGLNVKFSDDFVQLSLETKRELTDSSTHSKFQNTLPSSPFMRWADKSQRQVYDSIAAVSHVLDRFEIRKCLNEASAMTGGLVQWAPAFKVTEHTLDVVERMKSSLADCDALICKPCISCGIHRAHNMVLVWDTGCLPPVMETKPYVVENFYNHNGTVFKCYVIGDRVFIRRKPSIPDINRCVSEGNSGCESHSSILSGSEGRFSFHSLVDMPTAELDKVEDHVGYDQSLSKAAEKLSKYISVSTGLGLFGFDLIDPVGVDGFMLVDVNAFPSFTGVNEAATCLRNLFQVLANNE